jgi:hypothetical protein
MRTNLLYFPTTTPAPDPAEAAIRRLVDANRARRLIRLEAEHARFFPVTHTVEFCAGDLCAVIE